MSVSINEVDRVEILTLQDNYIDLVSRDNTAVVHRAVPLKGMEIKNSILAEHGFSSLVTVTEDGKPRSIIFDFGFSEHGAAFNADALNLDLTSVEALALSHGHPDHTGGLGELSKRVNKKGIELVVHPAAFRNPRYSRITDEFKVYFPAFTREQAQGVGASLIETAKPYSLLDGVVLFLGEIPRKTDFEKGALNFRYEEKGEDKFDPIEDDTALVFRIKGKGLIVLSGCAHSGIINTARYAREVTGVNQLFAVMGGFHLSGADFDSVIAPTTQALKDLKPEYVIPTHCTGRVAVMHMEKEMPDKFLLNMSGTKLTFSS